MGESFFYRAPGARTGDVIPKFIDGKWQLFYLKSWKDPKNPDAVHGWHRMDSKDLLSMGKETPIGVLGGTGDLIFAEGRWHLFACRFPQGNQQITHFISRDGSLDHWDFIEEDTFGPDGEIYGGPDWRDPRIIRREDLGEYWMFVAARTAEGHSQTGCVGLCVSRDLKKWEYRQPVYSPRRFAGACECPDFFRMGEWEYLVFSSYTTLFGTYYVKRKAGEEDWRIPKNHRLDGRAFYAAKTAGSGSMRCLFGWNPTKEEDLFGFWPKRQPGQDYRSWDWGGNMVIHGIRQLEDGDLGLYLPKERKQAFCEPAEMKFHPVTPGWEIWDGQAKTLRESGCETLLCGRLPKSALVSVEISAREAVQAGVVLHMEADLSRGYFLFVEPERKRLVFRSWLRQSEEGGKTFPYDVELETPVRTPKDGIYRMENVTEQSVGTAYINGEAALSFRMYDCREGEWGLFSFGKAAFFSPQALKRKEGQE